MVTKNDKLRIELIEHYEKIDSKKYIFKLRKEEVEKKLNEKGIKNQKVIIKKIAFSINLSRICKYIDENNRNILSNLLKQVNKSYFFNLIKSNFLILKLFLNFIYSLFLCII